MEHSWHDFLTLNIGILSLAVSGPIFGTNLSENIPFSCVQNFSRSKLKGFYCAEFLSRLLIHWRLYWARRCPCLPGFLLIHICVRCSICIYDHVHYFKYTEKVIWWNPYDMQWLCVFLFLSLLKGLCIVISFSQIPIRRFNILAEGFSAYILSAIRSCFMMQCRFFQRPLQNL